MIKLEQRQDIVREIYPITLEKAKKKKIWKDLENNLGVLKEKYGDLFSSPQESLKNLLFINLPNLGKKEENFFMETGEE